MSDENTKVEVKQSENKEKVNLPQEDVEFTGEYTDSGDSSDS